jgi:putative transposase
VKALKVYKTIKGKIIELRKGKEELLRREYENFQRYLHGDKSVQLHYTNKYIADMFLNKLKGKVKSNKEYPFILRRNIYRANTKLTPYWIKIPVYDAINGINAPIKTHEPITKDMRCKEIKIIRKDNEWFVYITVEKEVEERKPKSVLAIDVGLRWIAVTVNSNELKPKFYGKELRRIEGHYTYLRRALISKKAFRKLKKIREKEKRVVDDALHKISRTIVNEALKNNSMIVFGDLKGIIKEKKKEMKKSRKFRFGFPFYKFSKFIEYKAKWLGIKVIKIDEKYTSKTCHKCKSIGLRVGSLFKCLNCNYQCNADYNGAMNILKRAMGYMPIAGAGLTQPITRLDEWLFKP